VGTRIGQLEWNTSPGEAKFYQCGHRTLSLRPCDVDGSEALLRISQVLKKVSKRSEPHLQAVAAITTLPVGD